MVNMQDYIVFGFSAIALYTFVLVSLQHLISECQPGPGLIKVIYGFGLELAELLRMLKGAVAEFGGKEAGLNIGLVLMLAEPFPNAAQGTLLTLVTPGSYAVSSAKSDLDFQFHGLFSPEGRLLVPAGIEA